MKIYKLVIVIAFVAISACSKLTEENFAKIEEGMSEQQVMSILGTPTESNSVSLLGVSGTNSRWASGKTVITVNFVNGKVAMKTLDKPAN